MKTKISAMIDGELDAQDLREACASLRHDEDLRRACTTYLLIGDALRREPYLATELTGAVADHLADEPVVLAPRALKDRLLDRNAWHRPALALAATVAGVAVVAWLGVPRVANNDASLLPLAMTTPALTQTVDNANANAGDFNANDMQEYLIAHQIHGGSSFLNSETQHIRTVALNGMEVR